MTKRALALTILFSGVAIVGCGDDDPPPSASGDDAAEEEVNPCSPDAPAEATALEGEPAAEGAPITDVVGVEYRFEDVPTTLPAGPHGFRLIGEGDEFHELALIRVNDDRPIETLLELPEDEQEEVTEYIGGLTACPGETSEEALGVTLEPGRYALVCFVPVGTTPDLTGDELLAAYENPSHLIEGMSAEIVVE